MYSFFILTVYEYCKFLLLSFCLLLYTYIFDLFYISWSFLVPAVNHTNMNKSILISINEFYGITGNPYTLYKSYLTNRYQRTLLFTHSFIHSFTLFISVDLLQRCGKRHRVLIRGKLQY